MGNYMNAETDYYETLKRCVELSKTELEGRYGCFQSFSGVDSCFKEGR